MEARDRQLGRSPHRRNRKDAEKPYNTVQATLAANLYNCGLPSAQKSYAQLMKKIDYKQGDQVLAVQQTFDLNSVDSPMVIVTRLIDSFNKVSSVFDVGRHGIRGTSDLQYHGAKGPSAIASARR